MKKRIIILLCLLVGFAQALSAAEQGDTIPDCTLTATGDTTTYNFKQFQGKVLYVDFADCEIKPKTQVLLFVMRQDSTVAYRAAVRDLQ
jgi:hypothetical protein